MPTAVPAWVTRPLGPRENFGRAAISMGVPSAGAGVAEASETARATDGVDPSCTWGVVEPALAWGELGAWLRRVVTWRSLGRGCSWAGSAQGPSTGTGAKPAPSAASSPPPKARTAARYPARGPGARSRAAKVGRTGTAGSARRAALVRGAGRASPLRTARGSASSAPASATMPSRAARWASRDMRSRDGSAKPAPSTATVEGTRSPGMAGARSVRSNRVLPMTVSWPASAAIDTSRPPARHQGTTVSPRPGQAGSGSHLAAHRHARANHPSRLLAKGPHAAVRPRDVVNEVSRPFMAGGPCRSVNVGR